MIRSKPTFSPFNFTIATLIALTLAACGGAPASKTVSEPASQPVREKFSMKFDGGFSLDYQVERKISSMNGKTCYAFITGTLNNQSGQTLSRKSVLDFIVISQGRQLFRDITNPVADIPPGGRAMFEMVDSPVHKDGCPVYEKINVSLRKVLLDQ